MYIYKLCGLTAVQHDRKDAQQFIGNTFYDYNGDRIEQNNRIAMLSKAD